MVVFFVWKNDRRYFVYDVFTKSDVFHSTHFQYSSIGRSKYLEENYTKIRSSTAQSWKFTWGPRSLLAKYSLFLLFLPWSVVGLCVVVFESTEQRCCYDKEFPEGEHRQFR